MKNSGIERYLGPIVSGSVMPRLRGGVFLQRVFPLQWKTPAKLKLVSSHILLWSTNIEGAANCNNCNLFLYTFHISFDIFDLAIFTSQKS